MSFDNYMVSEKKKKLELEDNFGVTPRKIPWSHEVMQKIRNHPRDKCVSPILQEWLDQKGIILDGVERYPEPQSDF